MPQKIARVVYNLAMIGLIFSVGCAQRSSPESTSTATPTHEPDGTESAPPPSAPPTTVKPTITPTATNTPVPTPTPYPPIVWAEGIEPVMLGEYTAQWSPMENVLLLDSCPDLASRDAAILRADAPDFAPILLNEIDVECDNSAGAVWSPDGQHIVFSGRILEDQSSSLLRAALWMMEKDGSNPHAVNPEENTPSRWITFLGWMGNGALVYTIPAGLGANEARIVDVSSEEMLAKVLILGGFNRLNSQYLAATYANPYSFVIVISSSPDFGNSPLDSFVIESADYVRANPSVSISPEEEWFDGSLFINWRGDTSQMLVQYIEHSYEGENYSRIVRLVLWDVEEDSASILAEGGVDGQFSPDGDVLAFLTFGLPWLNPDGTPIERHYAPIPLDQPTYLNLLDMRSQIVVYSAPAIDEVIQRGIEDDPAYRSYKLLISFSPDGRYLAYFAPNNTPGATLNVLDLNTMQVVYATPADTLRPVWSPDADSMIFRDSEMRLNVLDRATMTTAPIIESGGQRVQLIDWSFDGQYFTLSLRESQRGHPYTAVLPQP
jgi:hypothetical protein